MTQEQCLALVAADTRVREAARDVVKEHDRFLSRLPIRFDAALAQLAVALAEFDKAMEEGK